MPQLILHGSADDYVPAAPCRSYVERLRKAGKNVDRTEYPGAFHVFDGVQFKAPVKLKDAQTTRKCRIEEATAGNVVNADSKQPFLMTDPCVERGTTVAYQERSAQGVNLGGFNLCRVAHLRLHRISTGLTNNDLLERRRWCWL